MSRSLFRTCCVGAFVVIAIASHCGIADAQLFRRWRGGWGGGSNDCCCYDGFQGGYAGYGSYNNWGGGYVSTSPTYSGSSTQYVGDGCGGYATQPMYQGGYQSGYRGGYQGGAYNNQPDKYRQPYDGYPQPYTGARPDDDMQRNEMRDPQFRDETRIEQRTEGSIQQGVPVEPRPEPTPRDDPAIPNPSLDDDNTRLDSRIETDIETRQYVELNGDLPGEPDSATFGSPEPLGVPPQEPRPQQPPRQEPPRPNVGDVRTDSQAAMSEFLASKLILSNNAEIQCAQQAMSKLSNPEAKAFAQTIVKDHSDFNQQLQPLAATYAGKAVVSADGAARPDADRIPDRAADRVAGDRPDAPNRTLQETGFREAADRCYADLFAVCEKAYQNADQISKKMMDEYSGADFDMAFVGSQIVKHQMVLAELQAIESTVSGELKGVVSNGIGTTEQHLQKAKDLAHQLKGGDHNNQ